MGSTATSTEDDPGSDYKSEIIPTPIIMYFIHINIFCKKGYYEGNRGNDTVPESLEESSCTSIIRRYVLDWIFAWKTGGYDQKYDDDNGKCDN